MTKFLSLLIIFTLVCMPAMAGVKQDAEALRAEADQLIADAEKIEGDADALYQEADALKASAENLNGDYTDAQAAEAAAKTTYDDAVAAYNAAKAASDADKKDKALQDAKDAAKTDMDNAESDYLAAQSDTSNALQAYNDEIAAEQAKRSDGDKLMADAQVKRDEAAAKDAEAATLEGIMNEEPFVFADELNDFLNTKVDGSKTYGQYSDAIDGVVSDIEGDNDDFAKRKDRSIATPYDGNSDAFFNEAVAKYKEMVPAFDASKDKMGIDEVRQKYEEDIADFVAGYHEDMLNPPTDKDGNLRFTFDDYKSDFGNLNDFTQVDLDNLVDVDDEAQSGQDRLFDPETALDRSVEGALLGAAKIELGWVGVGNKGLGGNNLYDAFKNMKGKFNGYAIKDDFAWFDQNWQAQEGSLSDLAVKSTTASYSSSSGSFTQDKTWVVDAYGNLVPGNDTSQYEYDFGKPGEQLTSYVKNERYNNRSYGYKYSNGTYNLARVTVGKKQYVFQHTVFTSPIVLDMNNDGKLEASQGKWLPHEYEGGQIVEFDINGDGFLELIEWVGPNDGLLLNYTEGMTEVTGNELFGEAGGWDNGYEKLMLLDANNDYVLDATEMAGLSVWQDKNGNVLIDEGEVQTVEALGITSMNISHDRYVSSFVRNNQVQTMWDWYPVTLHVKRSE